eukprot:GHVS01065886.1.p1 GENE.GHVS01065886.1~~GHVS01065886.1.p1  ORF type:complete len:410 (-),score=136.29 GHVS01065886.1:11-1120(-)
MPPAPTSAAAAGGGGGGGSSSASSCLSRGIGTACVSNRSAYIAGVEGGLMRLYVDEKELAVITPPPNTPNDGREIRNLFLEPKGYHAIASLANGQNWYIGCQSDQAYNLPRLNSHIINCIAWNKQTTETSTKTTVLGTRQGLLLELSIEDNKERECRVLYQFSSNVNLQAIYWDVLPCTPSSSSSSPSSRSPYLRNCIICAAQHALYEFAGGPNLEGLFRQYQQRQHHYRGSSSGGGGGGGGGGHVKRTADKVIRQQDEDEEEEGGGGGEGGSLRYEVGGRAGRDLMVSKDAEGQPVMFWLCGAGILSSPLSLVETAETPSPPPSSPSAPATAAAAGSSRPSHRLCVLFPPEFIPLPPPFCCSFVYSQS